VSERWLAVQPAREGEPRFRLVCLPYAGGGITTFHGWAAALPAGVEVAAVRLPGRGTRLAEPLVAEMPVMASLLADALAPVLHGAFGFFGHSMGARIAFELTRELARRGHEPPARLWASASRAPHLPPKRRPIHALPDDEFIAELRGYEGAPPALFDDRDLMQLYLPVLRADLALHDNYAYRADHPLDVPIAGFAGADDRYVDRDEVAAWARHTSAGFELRAFDGGHFFVHSARDAVLAQLARDLDAWS
jgi:surfactin synthase thioesterase subunit